MDNGSIEMLLVEQDPADIRETVATLNATKFAHQVHVVQSGSEALAYLRQEEPYAHAVSPDLVLLDLSLSKPTGLEILAEMKADPHIQHIPVVVLTTTGRTYSVRSPRMIMCH